MKLRITHVIPSLDPAFGGPPAVVARLAAAQAELGHEVRILSHPGTAGRAEAINESLRDIPSMDAVEMVHVDYPARLGVIFAPSAAGAIGDAVRWSNIVHVHGVWEPLLLKVCTEARTAGIPYVITPHGMLDPWCLRKSWLKKKLALLLAYRRMLQSTAFVHLLTKDAWHMVKSLRLRVKHVVIPNGVFRREVQPLPPHGTFIAQHPELAGKRYALFLSRLHPKKGLDILATAFSRVVQQMPQAHLVVVGPDGGAQASFMQDVSRLGIGNHVTLCEALYGQAKLAAIEDASCFCLPSRQEGFSVAIIEAMACATPVVISRECHFPEAAEAGAGFEVELSPDAVASAILELLRNPGLAQQMGLRGQKLVFRTYLWSSIAQTMCEAYMQAMGRLGARVRETVHALQR